MKYAYWLSAVAASVSIPSVASSPMPSVNTWRTTFKRPTRKAGIEHALAERGRTIARYHPKSDAAARHHSRQLRALSKRQANSTSTAELPLIDENADQLYQATVMVGTPPAPYSIVLDTGSADFFLLGAGCQNCAQANTTDHRYDGSASSSYRKVNGAFNNPYGSGTTNGTIGTETVKLGGFTVPNQTFAVINSVSGNVVGQAASGLMGFGFSSLSSLGTNWWTNTLKSWEEPLFSFALANQVAQPHADIESPGGVFTIGETDSSLYSGSINYVDIPEGKDGYWFIPIDSVNVNGTARNTTGQFAAIDTGTTLISGPVPEVEAFYSAIPGAQKVSSEGEDIWLYPCGVNVTLSLTFGGIAYPVNPKDFSTEISNGTCYGALFALDSTQSNSTSAIVDAPATNLTNPDWVVGDTFIKNVYAVFRATPPSVGFASLSNPTQLATSSASGITYATGSTTAVLSLASSSNGGNGQAKISGSLGGGDGVSLVMTTFGLMIGVFVTLL